MPKWVLPVNPVVNPPVPMLLFVVLIVGALPLTVTFGHVPVTTIPGPAEIDGVPELVDVRNIHLPFPDTIVGLITVDPSSVAEDEAS